MAGVVLSKGYFANLPLLVEGELVLAIDKRKVYLGTKLGKRMMLTEEDKQEIYDYLNKKIEELGGTNPTGDLSKKANKVLNPVTGDIVVLTSDGDITGSGFSVNSLNASIVSSATANATSNVLSHMDSIITGINEDIAELVDKYNALLSESHSPYLLGTKTVDESGLGDGKYLKFDGNTGKLVYDTPEVGTPVDGGLVGSKSVDESGIGDQKILQYSVSKDKVEYVDKPTGGEGGASTAHDVSYTNTIDSSISNVEDALNKLLYVAISGSIYNNVGTVEKGTIVSSVTLSWSYNKTPTSQSLSTSGTPAIPALNISDRSYVYTNPITSNKTFSLSYSDGKTSPTTSTSVNFLNKRYYGVSSKTDVSSQSALSLLVGDLSGELSSSRAQSRTLSGNNQYMYFMYPASFGLATFKVNGLQNTAWELSSVSFTNSKGYTENYYIYRSTYLQSGSGIVVDVS